MFPWLRSRVAGSARFLLGRAARFAPFSPFAAMFAWLRCRAEGTAAFILGHMAQLAPFALLAALVLVYIAGFYVLAMPFCNHQLTLSTGLPGTRGELDCVKLADVIEEHSRDDRDVWSTNSQSYYYVRNFKIKSDPSYGSVANAQNLHAKLSNLAVVQDGLIGNDVLGSAPGHDPASRRDSEIRSLYHLGQSYLYVVIRKADREKYRKIDDFTPGTKVYTGPTGSAARLVAERVLHFYQPGCIKDTSAPEDQSPSEAQPGRSPCEVIASMAGELALPPEEMFDAAFILGNPHVKLEETPRPTGATSKEEEALESCKDDIVRYVAEHQDRLAILPIDRAKGLAWTFHFLDAVEVPRGSYPTRRAFPDAAIETVATNTILACRADLPAHQAYQIVRTLDHHQNKLAGVYGEPTPIPAANPQEKFKYRLHDGALPYYSQEPDGDYITLAHLLGTLGVCFTAAVYFNNASIKRRVDLIARDIKSVFEEQGIATKPESSDESSDDRDAKANVRKAIYRLETIKRKALIEYREGVIDKEGYERIKECVDLALIDVKPLQEAS